MREFNPMRCAIQKKSEPREVLKGVYHDKGYKIGTDARILAKVQADYPKGLEGKVIGKDGKVIKEKFPNYHTAFFSTRKCSKFSIDAAKLKETIDKAKAIKKDNPLIYLVIADEVKATIEYAQLILAFIKNYGISNVYINPAKTTLLFTDSNNQMLYMTLSGSDDAIVINNQITVEHYAN
ncbi:MAG: hypothetical protein SNJ29_15715 [Rikenellaceae bacterium]